MPSLACVAHFSLEQFCISLQAISLITATFHLPPLTISLCLGFILLICSWLLISGYSGKLSITYCRSSMYVFHQKRTVYISDCSVPSKSVLSVIGVGLDFGTAALKYWINIKRAPNTDFRSDETLFR